jgi:hypothetical protein
MSVTDGFEGIEMAEPMDAGESVTEPRPSSHRRAQAHNKGMHFIYNSDMYKF